MKKLRAIVGIVIACLLVSQLIRPTINNPPVTGEVEVPPEVKQVLRKACYDCHSNETKLLWFDKITPANFLVAKDVREGRNHLNFSAFDSLGKEQQNALLFESINQMSFGEMPPTKYTRFHGDAKISEQDIQVLKKYLFGLLQFGKTDSLVSNNAEKQYRQWVSGATQANRPIQPALNGIAFMPDYKNWHVISQTERADNGTLRLMVGNDVAIKAIQNNQTNPWPDGVSFAKIAWYTMTDSAGIGRTGAFKQVELMVKEKEKYKETLGWGFARWINGINLTPYGKDIHFASECVRCHTPMEANDFVFTIPVIPLPQDSKAIATGIDNKQHTSFVLFENLSLVTWNQREDPHWFGAYIPGTIKSVESISPSDGHNNDSSALAIFRRRSVLP
jgi:hypothetical protein